MGGRSWREAELETLREEIERGTPTDVIASKLGRTAMAVRVRADMGLDPLHLGWTEAEDGFLLRLVEEYGYVDLREAVKILSRWSVRSVRRRCGKLGSLPTTSGVYQPYSFRGTRKGAELRLQLCLAKWAIWEGECLVWHGSRSGSGHASFKIDFDGSRASSGHRSVWLIMRGPIPDGLWVLHRCNNAPCVNIDHLYLGTPRQNAADRVEAGTNFPDPLRYRYPTYVLHAVIAGLAGGVRKSEIARDLRIPYAHVAHMAEGQYLKRVPI